MSELTQAKAPPTPSVKDAPVGALQRKCACGTHTVAGGECGACGRRRLQRRALNRSDTPEVPAVVHDVLRSSGRPLDAATRSFMEPRFGHDFSRVRVHTDAQAAESAQAVNALAYTVGSEIVLGAGQYAPQTNAGRRLLAHELTHVIQQSSGTSTLPAGIGPANDVHEQAAESMAHAVMDAPQEESNAGRGATRQSRHRLNQLALSTHSALLQRTCKQNSTQAFYARTLDYCRDSGFSGMLHRGQTCYRSVPKRTSPTDCPPGDQVCFDAQGNCHDSWDNASPVEGREGDGTCNIDWTGECGAQHNKKDKVTETFLDQYTPDVLKEQWRREAECRAACETQPWYLKGFCLMGCGGHMPM